MDAFWIIKSNFSLFGEKSARQLPNNFDVFFNFVYSIYKKCKKKCLNPKNAEKTD